MVVPKMFGSVDFTSFLKSWPTWANSISLELCDIAVSRDKTEMQETLSLAYI